MHHAWDPLRFMRMEPVEPGYERFFGSELKNRDAIILVAIAPDADGEPVMPTSERSDAVGIGTTTTEGEARRRRERVVGYAYGRIEPRDWNSLLDACGALHDIYVDERARRGGVAKKLLGEMLRRLEELGAPRVVLHSAWANAEAQRFFESQGFRRTMVEMTRERSSP
jgi:ribosomal protein S18 acetylase RimI-like enzyme